MRVVFSVSTIHELKELGGFGPEKGGIFPYGGYLGLGYNEELNFDYRMHLLTSSHYLNFHSRISDNDLMILQVY